MKQNEKRTGPGGGAPHLHQKHNTTSIRTQRQVVRIPQSDVSNMYYVFDGDEIRIDRRVIVTVEVPRSKLG